MPNWCSTRVEITGDVNKIFRLEQNINEWSQTDVVENGFVRWLGNVVQNSGIGSYNDYKCRGYITDMYSCANNKGKTASLCIYTDTAWAPMLDMWFDIVAKYIPEAELQYSAEEPGSGIYVTNMPEYDGKYIFDIFEPGEIDYKYESEYELSEDSLAEILADIMKKDKDEVSLEGLLEMWNEDYSDIGSVHKWDYSAGYEGD